jgi:hypothetical protein
MLGRNQAAELNYVGVEELPATCERLKSLWSQDSQTATRSLIKLIKLFTLWVTCALQRFVLDRK